MLQPAPYCYNLPDNDQCQKPMEPYHSLQVLQISSFSSIRRLMTGYHKIVTIQSSTLHASINTGFILDAKNLVQWKVFIRLSARSDKDQSFSIIKKIGPPRS